MIARRVAALALLVASALMCGACGGSTSGGGTGADGGGGGGGGGTLSPGCPASAPAAGAACTATITCEYGNDANDACNTVATCNHVTWSVAAPGANGATCPTPTGGSGCPSSYSGVAIGTTCSPQGLVCAYSAGRCECTTQVSGPPRIGGGARWACAAPEAGCPSQRPNLGTTCSTEGQSCDYGSCTLPDGAVEVCTGGAWVASATACAL